MTREGYYYLVDFNSNINKNLIIYKHNIFSLLLSLSWLHVHGTKDRLLSHEERIKKIANNKLSLTCGDISLFIQRLLQQKGIERRIASFLTMEQWNTYDNVHTLLEVKVDEKWTLFDIDNNRYFMYKNKEMNLRDFFEDIARCNISALKSDVKFGFYNVGTEVQTTIKTLCETMLRLKNSNLKIKFIPYSADDARQLVQNRIGSREKAERELGFKYKYSLEEGLKKLIAWREANEILG